MKTTSWQTKALRSLTEIIAFYYQHSNPEIPSSKGLKFRICKQ